MSSWLWQAHEEPKSQSHPPTSTSPLHDRENPQSSQPIARSQNASTTPTNGSAHYTATAASQPLAAPPSSSSPPSANSTTWSPLRPSTTIETVTSTLILTSVTLTALHIYKTYLRRIPTAASIPQSLFRHPSRTIYGRVAAVTDADNFRLFHTPGGIFNLWRTYPPSLAKYPPFKWRHIPTSRKNMLAAGTIHVRIAGIDAPELAHFGRPAQPHSKEAIDWLAGKLEVGRRVRVRIWRRDQYERVVGTAWIRSGWGRKRDVGLDMLRAGWATVYEAKYGAEFGGSEKEGQYRLAEADAKTSGRGMWAAAARPSKRSPMFAAWKPASSESIAGGKHIAGSVASKRETSQLEKESKGVLSRLWRSLISALLAKRQTADDEIKGEAVPAFETPREYKTRMARLDAQKAAAQSRSSLGR